MSATVIPFPRDLLRDPEVASATDLVLSAESDEEYDAALYGVVEALRMHKATAAERSPVWRLILGTDAC